MKRIMRTAAVFFLLVLAAACCLCGCGGSQGYTLYGPDGEKEYSVTFKLENPTYPDLNTGEQTTVYLRLRWVYLKVAKVKGEGTLNLARAKDADSKVQSYDGTVKASSSWINPFDFSQTAAGNLDISVYNYYRLTARGGDISIGEIAFICEKLTQEGGDGTGEYYVLTPTIVKATPVGNETESKALERANLLLDDQPFIAAEVI